MNWDFSVHADHFVISKHCNPSTLASLSIMKRSSNENINSISLYWWLNVLCNYISLMIGLMHIQPSKQSEMTKYSKMEYSGVSAWWLAWCVSNHYTRNLLTQNVNIFPVQCPIQEVSHFDCSSWNKIQYIPWWIETLVSTLIHNLQTLQSKYFCQV